MVMFKAEDLMHYGTPRKSGRYPWGSGGDHESYMTKRNITWLDLVKECRASDEFKNDKEIYEAMGMKSGEFRARMTIERNRAKLEQIHTATLLKQKGMANKEISRQMFGVDTKDTTVGTLLKADAADKASALMGTANMLKDEVDRKKFIDIGEGVENHLGVSKEKLRASVDILKQKGYVVEKVKIPQLGTKHETELKVLCPPGTTQHDLFMNRYEVQQLDRFSIDGGKKWAKKHDPIGVDAKRIKVRYAEEGGDKADGVIYVRPGAKDLSLGENRYAQVRVAVKGPNGEITHYLKGMAIYKDDLPAGVDIEFNTNKSSSDPKILAEGKLGAMKAIKAESELPFGAVVRQITKNTGEENEVNISAMNIVNGEGAWKDWSKSISTQVLSKQSGSLVREQLTKTQDKRQKEFDEIMSLTNPTVKKKLLEAFAGETDNAAVHLNAVSLTKDSAWHVILPIEKMKPTEVFAPGYENGTRVALIRYPHGGPFEIPELTVNNAHREARKMIGLDSIDAIGIHPDVAERLSGADFDGDTVIVVPNNSGKLRSKPMLAGLKGFEPKRLYKLADDAHGIKDHKDPSATTGRIMGEASNLITDMTIRGASDDKILRAVKYSMVTIDAEKHHLDYKQAKKDFGIQALKDEFQFDPANPDSRGASTLISRAGAKERIPDRKLRPAKDGGPIDPKTGAFVYVPTGKTRTSRDGTVVPKTIEVKRLANTDDAHSLSTGHPIERMYADHSNKFKAMANKARLEAAHTPNLTQSTHAKKVYASEVESLGSKLHTAQLNAPRERAAQVIAGAQVRAIKQSNKNLDKEHLQRIEFRHLELARKRTGAGKTMIEISDREWEAIQAGAVSNARLKDILKHTDIDKVKKLATPKPKRLMSNTKSARAEAMLASGKYTRQQVAAALGVSVSTLDRAMDGEE